MTSVGAVILSFGHSPRFLGLLAEVTAVIDPSDVVVAHNPYSSEDAWLPNVPEGVRLIALPDNVGYGPAMNAGIGAVSSEWVMLLTHDAQLDRDQLRLLLRRCQDLAPDVGVAGSVASVSRRNSVVWLRDR
ncbi:MAG: glycosyltransferase family 2 protein [Solirubrobacteraceae bacterium]